MTDNLHRLLARQLKRRLAVADGDSLAGLYAEFSLIAAGAGVSPAAKAALGGMAALLHDVEEAYRQGDRDLELAKRSLDLSSQELSAANESLRQEASSRKSALDTLLETTQRALEPLGRRFEGDNRLDSLATQLAGLVNDLLATRGELERTLDELRNRQFALDQHAIVTMTDRDGNINYANDRFCEISGYSHEEMIGQNHRIVNSGVHSQEFFTGMWQTISSGRVWNGEVCNRSRDGSLYWVAATIVPFLDAAGQPYQYIAIRTDISGQKRLETELEASRHFLLSTMDTLGEGVYTLDVEGKCVFVNREAERLLGWSREEMEGRNLHDIIHFQTADGTPLLHHECAPQLAVQKGETYRSEQEYFTRKGGTVFPISLIASPLLESGRVTGSVAAFQDITLRKRIAGDLLQAKEAAEEASRAKSEFLATMSHEIRTPMNGVIGMTELALDTDLTALQREYLNVVKSSADSLLTVINDILHFSRIEAGKLDLESIPFRLSDTVGTSIKALAVRAEQKGIELVYEVTREVPEVLLGDPGRLRQVLVNLVGNAIKFSSRGEVAIRAELSEHRGTEVLVHFSVKDQGIGIPVEKQQLIFEAFTQADTSTTRKFGGTGLGLAICTRLVQGMGGRIWVDSVPDAGSTFHFTVLLGVADHDFSALLPPVKLQGKSVLILDDNAVNRRFLQDSVHKLGMIPTLTETGAEALSVVAARSAAGRPFDLLMLDAQLPEMDGFEVARKVRPRPGSSDPVIMVLSSAGLRGDAERCRELGISAYLSKPITQEELREAISDALHLDSLGAGNLVTRHSIHERHRPLRILLAEDNQVNQQLAVILLEQWGHSVQVAATGFEALAQLGNGSYDLILMDVQMPELGGLEATRMIREAESGSGRHIPIVAMTANAMQGDRERCLEAGMDGYISKPLAREELAAIVRGYTVPAEAAAAEPAPVAAFDYPTALARADSEIITIIAEPFMADAALRLAATERALASRERQTLQREAHTVKGLAGNFNAEPLVRIAHELEMFAEKADWSELEKLAAAMCAELQLLVLALRHFLENHGG